MFNIVVIGPPCSGKGTQSKRIAKEYQLSHISSGILFRKEINKKTPLGFTLKKYIDKGLLVPDEIVLKKMYKAALSLRKSRGVVFDGFPRTLYQAQTMDKSLKKKAIQIAIAVFIDVGEQELVKRLLRRSEDSERSDDSLEVIKKRIEVYKAETLPLIKYYSDKKKLITVSGMAHVETVCARIINAINNFKKQNYTDGV